MGHRDKISQTGAKGKHEPEPMTNLLLAIIAACVLFGGSAVSGAIGDIFSVVGAGVWFLISKIPALLSLLYDVWIWGLTIGGVLALAGLAYERWRSGPTLDPFATLPRFESNQDYLEWANREGRWADGALDD